MSNEVFSGLAQRREADHPVGPTSQCISSLIRY
jgi:hypothetical protein